jgi:MFS family permease
MLENILAGIFAVIFGFAADYFGRKRLLFLGFTLLGFGYATLGLFHSISGLYFYTLVDSIAWGIFTTLFILTIWGDIVGSERNGEKFFIIGFLPYVFSSFLQVIFSQLTIFSTANLTSAFFLLSLFLFIAVTPLYLAPETLSEKDKKDAELMAYLKKAQKKVETEATKTAKKQATITDDSANHEKPEK